MNVVTDPRAQPAIKKTEPVLHLGCCIEFMKTLEDDCIDLTVTSPPYDNLRTYNNTLNWNFEIFQQVAKELYRVTKPGGVVVWVVGDGTVKGSETGTSFRQALYFKECGFNLHDTMFWEKTGRIVITNRYFNIIDYMFVFSKGKPVSVNLICDAKCVNGGRKQRKDKIINNGNNKKEEGFFIRNEYGRRPNLWKIHIGGNGTDHPAIFPEQLASDHIISWSKENDTVFDPFMGSGTTGKMALQLNRQFLGCEIVPEYYDIACQRVAYAA